MILFSTHYKKWALEGLFHSVGVIYWKFIALVRQKGMIRDPRSRGWETIQGAIVPITKKGANKSCCITFILLHFIFSI